MIGGSLSFLLNVHTAEPKKKKVAGLLNEKKGDLRNSRATCHPLRTIPILVGRRVGDVTDNKLSLVLERSINPRESPFSLVKFNVRNLWVCFGS